MTTAAEQSHCSTINRLRAKPFFIGFILFAVTSCGLTNDHKLTDYAQVMPSDSDVVAAIEAQGVLSFEGFTGNFEELTTSVAQEYVKPAQLSDVQIRFTISDGQFLPAPPLLHTDFHPDWDWISMPGIVWRQNDGQSTYSVSFPIALKERNQDCTHTGLASFSFRLQGETLSDISPATLQMAQEVWAYFKFNLTGAYTSGKLNVSSLSLPGTEKSPAHHAFANPKETPDFTPYLATEHRPKCGIYR